MKRYAIDCELNKRRNIIDKKFNYTQSCDYDNCKYNCINKISKKIDFSTYGLLYSDLYYDAIVKKLKSEIKINHVMGVNDFIENIKNTLKIRSENIIEVLNMILNKNIEIVDRYGFIKHVYEDNVYLYLSDSILKKHNKYNN